MTSHKLHPEVAEVVDRVMDDDVAWFTENRNAVVRFRPALPGELDALDAMGEILGSTPISFVDLNQPDMPGGWVVVVDVIRLYGGDPWPYESARLRLECPPVRPGQEAAAEAILLPVVRRLLEITRQPPPKSHRPSPRGFSP